MTKAVQQPPTVITQPTRINTYYPETLYQLNINISVTRGLGMYYILFTNPSSNFTKLFKK